MIPMRRTPEQIAAFRDSLFAVLHEAPSLAMSIGDIAEHACVIGVRRKWTRVKRRQVNEALAQLRHMGLVAVVGQGKATKYHQMKPG